MSTKKRAKKVVKSKKAAPKKKVLRKRPVNDRFPGRPRYVGPDSGYFGFVHHGILYEYSYNIHMRIRNIKESKPNDEQAIRLWHLVYLAPVKSKKFDCATNTKVLRWIEKYIPNHRWNGHTLLKADGSYMTG